MTSPDPCTFHELTRGIDIFLFLFLFSFHPRSVFSSELNGTPLFAWITDIGKIGFINRGNREWGVTVGALQLERLPWKITSPELLGKNFLAPLPCVDAKVKAILLANPLTSQKRRFKEKFIEYTHTRTIRGRSIGQKVRKAIHDFVPLPQVGGS